HPLPTHRTHHRPRFTDTTNRSLKMPRRTHTRTTAINDERRHNQTLIETQAEAAERNKPPV
ncbi:MAG: hypothetical protein ACXWEI_23640, partial [Mycobacterium sp.]